MLYYVNMLSYSTVHWSEHHIHQPIGIAASIIAFMMPMAERVYLKLHQKLKFSQYREGMRQCLLLRNSTR